MTVLVFFDDVDAACVHGLHLVTSRSPNCTDPPHFQFFCLCHFLCLCFFKTTGSRVQAAQRVNPPFLLEACGTHLTPPSAVVYHAVFFFFFLCFCVVVPSTVSPLHATHRPHATPRTTPPPLPFALSFTRLLSFLFLSLSGLPV